MNNSFDEDGDRIDDRLARESDAGRRMDLIDDALRPPEPQLLDTCVLQNLDWVDRQREATGNVTWDDDSVERLVERYGRELANDLIDLGSLYTGFEARSGYPWLVCNTAIDEANLLNGEKGDRLRRMIDFIAGHQEQWCSTTYPGIAKGLLLTRRPYRISPLILKALDVQCAEEVSSPLGPLAYLPDRGDRLIAAHALLANIPVVLTTDRRTFWERRDQLLPLGVTVMRPGELLELYEPYWIALNGEFARRQARAGMPSGD
jgi:hypothetical protein